jgi:multiple sugar transport system ATP-binding protein
MKMQLECKGLNFHYPGTGTAVLDNLFFTMKGPGFNAVFGPSGVGKTSLAKLLSAPAAQDPTISCSGIHRVLYSYNQERLPGWSSTGRHLDRICPDQNRALKQELIQIFQLEPVLGSRFSQLSMGQQNRMNLLRYLLQEFDLLILDESLANVDEALRQTIILNVKTLFPEKMFLYISHNLMEVARFCKDILVLAEPGQSGQSTLIRGLDCQAGSTLDRKALDRVMLEIMNAV